MQAVIRIGGKQLVVAEGQTFYAEFLTNEAGSSFSAPEVLALIDGEATTIGAPTVDGAAVTLKVLRHGKFRKVRSIRYKRRKMVHKVTGHRQPYSWLMVESISK